MAGFVNFGRGIYQATRGIDEGREEGLKQQAEQQQIEAGKYGIAQQKFEQDLQNQLLEQVKAGKLPMAALYDTQGYFKQLNIDQTTRAENVQFGQQMLADAENLIDYSDPKNPKITDKTKYDAYRAAAFDFLGAGGQGTLMQPSDVFRIHGLSNASDAMQLYLALRNANLANPKPVPYQMMGPGGATIVGALGSHLNPDGSRTVETAPLGPPGSVTPFGASGPTSGASAGYSGPGLITPNTGPITPQEFSLAQALKSALQAKGFSPTQIAQVLGAEGLRDGPVGSNPVAPAGGGGMGGTGFPAGSPPPSAPAGFPTGYPASAPPPGGVTKVSWPVPPDKVSMNSPAPPPVPKAWGGIGYPSPYLRPKLTPQDANALGSLDGVLHQMELLYRMIRAIPPSVRRGAPGAVIDWLKLHSGISSGETIDGLMSQIGAAKASLIAGFQSAGKTRAFAAIKMVQDHYPQLYDSDDLILHKLEQLLRPDGYLTFARNAILYGPEAAAAGAKIDEPLVAPPGSIYDSTRAWHYRDGTEGMMLDGIPYRRDTDGYWVQVMPRGGSR